jgi:hypothetical protein
MEREKKAKTSARISGVLIEIRIQIRTTTITETPYVRENTTARFKRVKSALTKKNPWPESASELYRLSERRLSAKLVQTFADRGVSHSQHNGSLRPYSRLFRLEPLLFLSSSSSIVLTRLSGPRSRVSTSQKIW